MKIAISASTGYNARELLLPLREHLEQDAAITEVHIITPAAPYHAELFPTFGPKFHWHQNPSDLAGHVALFSTVAPSVILTPTVGLDVNDTYLLRAGKQLTIPTVTFIASWDNVFKMERLRDRGFSGPLKNHPTDFEFPDYLAVWNEMNRMHVLEKFGNLITAERLTITGPPRFDYFSHHDRIPSRHELINYLGWTEADADKPLLHFATTELYPFEYIIRTVYRAIEARQLPRSLLYASVHPGGDLSRHQHYTTYGAHVKYSFGRREHSPMQEFTYLPTDPEIYLLIALWKHTDVLINQSSTVAIESMAADRPVINVTYGQPLDWLGWRRATVYRDFTQHYRYITEHGGTTLASKPRELVAAVTECLENPAQKRAERQRTLQGLITYTDGSSSRRLLEYIKACAAH